MSIENESNASTSAHAAQPTAKTTPEVEAPETRPAAEKSKFESVSILLEESDDVDMDDESIYSEEESMLKEAESEEQEEEQATNKSDKPHSNGNEEEEESNNEQDDDDEFVIDIKEIQEDLNADCETNPFDPIDPANIVSGKRARKLTGTGSSAPVSNA